jgi:hypothetical protein
MLTKRLQLSSVGCMMNYPELHDLMQQVDREFPETATAERVKQLITEGYELGVGEEMLATFRGE